MSIGLTAFQLLPIVTDGAFINRSRWEPLWKWDSFGAKEVLGLTATGDLLDARRLPVLTFLALAGAIVAWRRRREEQRFPAVMALAGAALWLFLFCGRTSWGPLYRILGLSDAAQLHRFIGGAQWFLLLLAGIGLARLWTLPFQRRWRWPAVSAIVLTSLILWPAISERRQFLNEGEQWGRENLAAYETYRDPLQRTIATAHAIGGRAYPGLAASWGAQLRVGYVPFYAFLSEAHVPAVAFLYHAMALPADVMVRFDENRPEHYRLFDVRSVIAESSRQLPPFLRETASLGPFRVLQAPPSGAFALVQVPRSFYVDRRTFYDVNDAWLQSQWPAADAYLALDYEAAVPVLPRPRLGDFTALRQVPQTAACGSVVQQSGSNGTYRAQLDVAGDCVALFKMTYHPKWRATVDGAQRQTVMLSPGFVGVPVPRGRHSVQIRYEPGLARPLLLGLAFPFLLGAFIAERKGLLRRLEERAEAVRVPSSAALPYALLVAALVLPLAAPFIGGAQPNGHDALQYLPRVTEFHENIRAGILFPRWAPDLGSGQGQPIFVVNPPLFYYLTEVLHLVGLSFVGAMNAACVLLIFAAAASMFLLGRWWFGASGGALAAIAYVYAPYFLVDLYVRTAFAEFSAFPFYPLVLYGFARHAESRQRKYLLIAALAWGAIWFAHSPAALLFSPLLGAFVLFLAWRARSARLLLAHLLTAAAGMLLSAAIWLPSVVEAKDTHAERLTVGVLRYSNHFVTPAQFFTNVWGYGPSVPGAEDGMPFTLGWPHLLVAIIAAVAIARSDSRPWKEWVAFFGGATFLLCFLMTERSHAVWDAVPQLHYVAFPWRLLASASFCLALVIGAIVLALPRLDPRWQRPAYAAIVAALVLMMLPRATPASYLSIDPEQWTPNRIAINGAVAGTFESFEPRWVTERPIYNGRAIAVRRGACIPAIVGRGPTTLTAAVQGTTDCELELPIAYFPGWHISVEGAEAAMEAPAANGRMRVTLTPGAHRIEAAFARTPVRWAGEIISL
ncbi:MAG TPA: glycosyltransferase family 39 protein, partial [Thermoanaerobaculia bacterium]|nr:glycosyltransferase family 39 protein [Thermoanaerobaculia bacterium]